MDPALAKEISGLSQNRAINEAIERGGSDIQQFYKDTTIFLTGGTGFLGKQLIEKLFRSCEIKKVYILMRPKRKKAFHERLNQMLEDPVFDVVKKMKPGFTKSLYPVQGDVAESGLGLSDEDRPLIQKEAEIIIHVAATVSFDEPLKVAAFTNVRGTMEVLNLARTCPKLKSLVHVSTAFSHCTFSRFNKDVTEQFYEPPLSPQLLVEMAETMEEKRLNDITPDLIRNWPNTYCFTKAIAEEACRQASRDLPICIVRPAIVIASNQEPSPGWMDMSCLYGHSGLVVGVGVGMLHVLNIKYDINIDVVPVDQVNNAIIAAGFACGAHKTNSDSEPKIYTVTNSRNPIKFETMLNFMLDKVLPQYPTPDMLYFPFFVATQNKLLSTLLIWLLHYIPAYFLDAVLWVIGRKQLAVKSFTRGAKLINLLSYFSTNEWKQSDKRLQDLYSSLSTTDQVIYNFDVAKFEWSEQLIFWCLGARKYLLHDKLEGTAYARKKLVWLKLFHYFIVLPLYAFLLWKMATLVFTTVTVTSSFVYGLVN